MLSSVLDIVPPTPPARTGQSRNSASEPDQSFSSLVDDNTQADMPQATAPAPSTDKSSSVAASAKSSENKSSDNKSADNKSSAKSPAIPVIDSAVVAADLALDLMPVVPTSGDVTNQLIGEDGADPLLAFLDAVTVATSPAEEKPVESDTVSAADDQTGGTPDTTKTDPSAAATVVAVTIVPVPTIDSATATGDGLPVDAVIAESAPAQVPLPGDDATTAETNAAAGNDPIVPAGDATTDGAPQVGKPSADKPLEQDLLGTTGGQDSSESKSNSTGQQGNAAAVLARASGQSRNTETQTKKPEAAATDTPAVAEADVANGTAPTAEANGAKPQHKTEAVATEAPAKPDAPTKPANERTSATPVDPFATRTPAFHVLMQQQYVQHVPGAAPTDNDVTLRNVPVSGIAVEIAGQFRENRTRFDIRLDPPDLGRIDVRLDVDRQGQVTSRLIVEKSETLDLLRRDAPQLERALQDAGLKTGDTGLQFSLRDQSFNGRDDDRAQNAAKLIVTDEEIAPLQSQTAAYGRVLARGGLDISV